MLILGNYLIKALTPPAVIPVFNYPNANTTFLITGKGPNTGHYPRDYYGAPITINNAGGTPSFNNQTTKWEGSISIFAGAYIKAKLCDNLTFANGPLTWEAWVYPTDLSSNSSIVIMGNARADAGGNYGLMIAIQSYNSGNTKYFVFRHWLNDNTTAINTSVNVQANTWYYVAATKSSNNTLNIFVNGIIGNQGSTSNPVDGNFYIGQAYNNAGYASTFTGYLSDIRLSKSILYGISTFSIPTQQFNYSTDPYQSSVTSFLNFETGTITDNISNTVTVNGNSTVVSSPTKYGSKSLSLDGTNSNVILSSPTSFQFGTNDFTIEGWFYFNDVSTNQAIFKNADASTSTGWALVNGQIQLWIDNVGQVLLTYTVLSANIWYYLSFIRYNGAFAIAINGTFDSINTSVNNSINLTNMSIGKSYYNGYLNAYIDEFIVTKGIARRIPNLNFTPPIIASSFYTDSYLSNNQLLLDFDNSVSNTYFFDYYGNTVTNNGATRSIAQSKFGGYSLYLNGTNSSIGIPKSSLNLQSVATPVWTIEFWIYCLSTSEKFLLGNYNINQGAQSNCLLITNKRIGSDNTYVNYDLPVNQWVHWVATRNLSGVISLYLNGTLITTVTPSVLASSNVTFIGGTPGDNNWGNSYINAYIDDLRISNDLVKAVVNVPTTTFDYNNDPYQSSLALLLTFENQTSPTEFVNYVGTPIITYGTPTQSNSKSKFGNYSLYLNGISSLGIDRNYLNLSSSVNPVWTIEAWVYCTVPSTTNSVIFTNYSLVNNQQTNCLIISNNRIGTDNTYFNYSLPSNQWIYFVITRDSSGIVSLYLNGVLINSILTTTIQSSSMNFIGTSPFDNNISTWPFQGYLDNIRITLANRYYSTISQRYTSNFTPNNYPSILDIDPYIYYTTVLIHGNGANNGTTFSNIGNNQPFAIGNCSTSTAQSKFNGSSIYFDGNASDYLAISVNPNYYSSVYDFTLETWIYKTVSGVSQAIMSNIQGVDNTGFNFLINSNDKLRFQSDNGTPDFTSNLVVPTNQWSYVALSKQGSNYTFSMNGTTQTIVDATSWGISSSSNINFGRTPRSDYPYPFTGYMQEIRLTPQYARDVSTLPTKPFPEI